MALAEQFAQVGLNNLDEDEFDILMTTMLVTAVDALTTLAAAQTRIAEAAEQTLAFQKESMEFAKQQIAEAKTSQDLIF